MLLTHQTVHTRAHTHTHTHSHARTHARTHTHTEREREREREMRMMITDELDAQDASASEHDETTEQLHKAAENAKARDPVPSIEVARLRHEANALGKVNRHTHRSMLLTY